MATTLRDLLQRFTLSAAGVALIVALAVGLIAGRAASRTLERISDQRGNEVASRATELVSSYIRERHREADRLAADPFVVRAATEAAGSAAGDADLTRFFRHYPEGSDFTDLFFTESHGLVVLASSRPDRSDYRNEPLWQQAIQDGAAEADPAI